MLVYSALALLLGSSAALAGPLSTADTNGTYQFCASSRNQDEVMDAEKYFQNQMAATNESSASAAAASINVYWHVISRDNTVSGGQYPDTVITQTIGVLNQNFGGTGLSFRLVNAQRTINANWYNTAVGSPAYQQMKDTLRQGGVADLNVYSIGSFSDNTLGIATFPDQYSSNPRQDGIVIDDDTLPGGSEQGGNTGKILVHEAGHWVGLLHTFEAYNYYPSGCYGPGDLVDDTPAEASPARDCPNGRDTCASPGVDPIHNHMDYTADDCRNQFTPGQIARLRGQMRIYRGVNI